MERHEEAALSALEYFGGCYFHEDFRDENGDANGAVRAFRSDETPQEVATLVSEVRAVLQPSGNEAELSQLWSGACRGNYEPGADGLTTRQWFERVIALLLGDDTATGSTTNPT